MVIPSLLIIKLVVILALVQILVSANSAIMCAVGYSVVCGGYALYSGAFLKAALLQAGIGLVFGLAYFSLLKHFYHKRIAWWIVFFAGLALVAALESNLIPLPTVGGSEWQMPDISSPKWTSIEE